MYQNTDGMTQQDLADAVGLSRSRVGDILSESDG
jgi:DNA-binding XRE family transcriptional regulator